MVSQAEGSTNGVNGVSSNENSEITSLISSLKKQLPDDGAPTSYDRKQLRETVVKLGLALESPGDTVMRLGYLPMQSSVVRIANDLKIFHELVNNGGPVTGKQLAETSNADHVMLLRLLRYLVAIGCIGETGVDTYVANNVTKNLVIQTIEAGVNNGFDIVGPAVLALPSHLARTKYQNPTNALDSPFTDGFRTKERMFDWLSQHPEQLRNFNLWMSGQREGRANWLDYFPFKEQLVEGFEGGDDAALLVDVGGGIGHEVRAIQKWFPDLPGHLVLQDLPNTVKQAGEIPGAKVMAHDFFSAQPVKGARAYYLRNILHDWPSDRCEVILGQIREAMKPGYSKVVLNELVLPDQGASIIGGQRDITMMSVYAGQERSEGQWSELFDKVGLKLEKIWTHNPEAESVVVAGTK